MKNPVARNWKMPVAKGMGIQAIYEETINLFLCMTALLEETHGGRPFSVPRRDLMLRLLQSGPQTVPQLARARKVSRQTTQHLVNELISEGFLELSENIAHKLSHLVRLTPKGKEYITSLLQREAEISAQMEEIDLSEEELRLTAAGLRGVREWLDREQQRFTKEGSYAKSSEKKDEQTQ
jgi:DNA-binding MarR family transcriptional regulator